jgi:hypothetical protein
MAYRRKHNMTDEELEKWFYDQKIVTQSGCWEWTRGINSGYGTLRVNKNPILAHRFSLQLYLRRPIEREIEVRHMCHNPKCINPQHLKEGTHSQNMADMVDANRQAKGEYLSARCKIAIRDKIYGENNGKSKLTTEQVVGIRNSDKSALELSKIYGVSRTQISRIIKGISWPHVRRTEAEYSCHGNSSTRY